MWDLPPPPPSPRCTFSRLLRACSELFDNDTDMMLHWQLGKKPAAIVLATRPPNKPLPHPVWPTELYTKISWNGRRWQIFYVSFSFFPWSHFVFLPALLIFPRTFFFSRWFAVRFRALFWGEGGWLGQCKRRSKLSFKQHVCKNHAPGYPYSSWFPSSWLLSLAVATFYS